jgi:hypothetical protein
VRLLQAAANISRVTKLVRLDWHTVNDVMERAVAARAPTTHRRGGAVCGS